MDIFQRRRRAARAGCSRLTREGASHNSSPGLGPGRTSIPVVRPRRRPPQGSLKHERQASGGNVVAAAFAAAFGIDPDSPGRARGSIVRRAFARPVSPRVARVWSLDISAAVGGSRSLALKPRAQSYQGGCGHLARSKERRARCPTPPCTSSAAVRRDLSEATGPKLPRGLRASSPQ